MGRLLLDVSDEGYLALMEQLQGRDILELLTRQVDAKYNPFVKARLADFDKEVQAALQLATQTGESIDPKTIKKMAQQLGNMKTDLASISANLSNLPAFASQVGCISQSIQALNAVQWLSVGINVLNLGVSIAGFAYTANQLDGISKQIVDLEKNVQKVVEKVNALEAVTSKFTISKECKTFMLNAQTLIARFNEDKKISEEKLVETIQAALVYLENMVELTYKLESEDIYTIIYSMLPLYTNLISVYIKSFYGEYKNGVHSNHSSWMSIFDKLCSKDFTNRMIDYYFINKHLHYTDIQKMMVDQFLMTVSGPQQINDDITYMQLAQLEGCDKSLKTLENAMLVAKVEDTLLPVLEEQMGTEEALQYLQRTLESDGGITVRVA